MKNAPKMHQLRCRAVGSYVCWPTKRAVLGIIPHLSRGFEDWYPPTPLLLSPPIE